MSLLKPSLPKILSVASSWFSCDRVALMFADASGIVEIQFSKSTPDIGYIWNLCVAPEHRRQRRAKALLQAAEQLIAARGCSESVLDWCHLDTPAWVLDWYKRQGYSHKPSDPIDIILTLRKDLAAPNTKN